MDGWMDGWIVRIQIQAHNFKAYAFTIKRLDSRMCQVMKGLRSQRVSILFWEQKVIEGFKIEE